MSCEQELNSSRETCVYIPALKELSENIGFCPEGYSKFDDKNVIPVSPVCIETTIPAGYTCDTPMHCTRPRLQFPVATSTTPVVVERYKLLKHAY